MITPDRLDSWRHIALHEHEPVSSALRDACDEIESLQIALDREMAHDSDHINDALADRDQARDAAVALEQENTRLATKLNAIAKLHSHIPLCVECCEIQPCDTLAIIDGGGS